MRLLQNDGRYEQQKNQKPISCTHPQSIESVSDRCQGDHAETQADGIAGNKARETHRVFMLGNNDQSFRFASAQTSWSLECVDDQKNRIEIR